MVDGLMILWILVVGILVGLHLPKNHQIYGYFGVDSMDVNNRAGRK